MPPRPEDEAAAVRLASLREHRVWRQRAEPLADSIARETESLRRLHRKLGDAGRAWGEVCPEEFADRAAPVALQSGVLTIAVADAPTRHRLGLWLRTEGERRLRSASRAPIRRVRLVIRRS
jgi:hypothetical protein